MITDTDLEFIMFSYNIPECDKYNFQAVWKVLETCGMTKTKSVQREIYGSDVSAVKTILDMFRRYAE